MNCPFCQTTLKTAETRAMTRELPPEWAAAQGPRGNAQAIYRRRKCPSCESLISTVEVEVVPGAQETFQGMTANLLPKNVPRRRKGHGDGI
jgi:hypothetical protein